MLLQIPAAKNFEVSRSFWSSLQFSGNFHKTKPSRKGFDQTWVRINLKINIKSMSEFDFRLMKGLLESD